ncbi:DUF4129 domain-containing protein [Streptomyces sp. NPDC100445]|uniref:DUF4129 domain-containing protein n=1 Tax=Streptomyces sp. NPDC100445 TaxID=3366102 RepID=UPI003822D505
MSLAGGVLTTAAPPGAAATAVRLVRRAADTIASTAGDSGDGPPVTIPRGPAREAARRELSERLYHQNDPSPLQRALDAFWDLLDRLLGSAASATPGGTVGLVVVTLFVAAVPAALWWRLGTPHRRPTPATALLDDRPRSAADHRAAGEAHAARGRWNQAVQERVRALVRSLEERGLLDPHPGRTADEAAAEAGRSLPAHTDRLRAAAREFDDVTYGGREASARSYHRIAALDDDLAHTRPSTADNATGAPHRTRRGDAE